MTHHDSASDWKGTANFKANLESPILPRVGSRHLAMHESKVPSSYLSPVRACRFVRRPASTALFVVDRD